MIPITYWNGYMQIKCISSKHYVLSVHDIKTMMNKSILPIIFYFIFLYISSSEHQINNHKVENIASILVYRLNRRQLLILFCMHVY